MSEKKKIGLLSLTSIASIVVLVITLNKVFNKEEQEKGILKVDFNKETKLVDLLDFLINPGDVIEYQVKTNAEENVNTKVELWFKGVNDNLNSAINVYCEYGDNKTSAKGLSTYTSSNRLSFTSNFSKEYNSFNLIFEMPFSVGNEHQNKTCEFDTYIKVSIVD